MLYFSVVQMLKYTGWFIYTGPPLKVVSVRLHIKSHRKSCKCQNFLRVWYFKSFLGRTSINKPPCISLIKRFHLLSYFVPALEIINEEVCLRKSNIMLITKQTLQNGSHVYRGNEWWKGYKFSPLMYKSFAIYCMDESFDLISFGQLSTTSFDFWATQIKSQTIDHFYWRKITQLWTLFAL